MLRLRWNAKQIRSLVRVSKEFELFNRFERISNRDSRFAAKKYGENANNFQDFREPESGIIGFARAPSNRVEF